MLWQQVSLYYFYCYGAYVLGSLLGAGIGDTTLGRLLSLDLVCGLETTLGSPAASPWISWSLLVVLLYDIGISTCNLGMMPLHPGPS